jgi:hypothetical protein
MPALPISRTRLFSSRTRNSRQASNLKSESGAAIGTLRISLAPVTRTTTRSRLSVRQTTVLGPRMGAKAPWLRAWHGDGAQNWVAACATYCQTTTVKCMGKSGPLSGHWKSESGTAIGTFRRSRAPMTRTTTYRRLSVTVSGPRIGAKAFLARGRRPKPGSRLHNLLSGRRLLPGRQRHCHRAAPSASARG